MKIKGAFTLAEVMVTVFVIGIAAAFILPSVILDNEQYRFESGLKKAVKDANDAIAYNIANGEKSAYYTTEDDSLVYYLQKGMNVTSFAPTGIRSSDNSEFYTKDGMRWEVPIEDGTGSSEFSGLKITGTAPGSTSSTSTTWTIKNYQCGTKGLYIGGSATSMNAQPCIILVDVNGNKGPNTLTDDDDDYISDMFLLIITDKNALPYGELAQSAYYDE